MIVALTIVCLTLAALLAYREKVAVDDRGKAARGLEEAVKFLNVTEQHRVEEREAAAEERRELYQRIQAPEVAVHEAKLEARRERPYKRRQPIGADDDAAFAARRAERQAERRAAEVDGG